MRVSQGCRVGQKHPNQAYPEVVASSGEDFGAIANKVGDESRAKITSQVDGVTGFPAQASTNAKDEEEQGKGEHLASANVVVIDQGENDKLENRGGQEFGEEHASAGHEGSRICAEDTSRGVGAGDGSETGAAFKVVDGRLVVSVDDGGSGHGTEELGNGVDGELAPGVAAVDAVGQGDGGVEMTTGLATNEDAKHDTDAVVAS